MMVRQYIRKFGQTKNKQTDRPLSPYPDIIFTSYQYVRTQIEFNITSTIPSDKRRQIVLFSYCITVVSHKFYHLLCSGRRTYVVLKLNLHIRQGIDCTVPYDTIEKKIVNPRPAFRAKTHGYILLKYKQKAGCNYYFSGPFFLVFNR